MEDKIGLLTPVKATRKSAMVAERIKSLILENRYGPGEKLPRTYHVICNDPKLAKRTLNLHQKIFEALRAQDPKRAKAHMIQHMKIAYQISKGYLEHVMETEGIMR